MSSFDRQARQRAAEVAQELVENEVPGRAIERALLFALDHVHDQEVMLSEGARVSRGTVSFNSVSKVRKVLGQVLPRRGVGRRTFRGAHCP